jgi:hypothetical protein
LVRVTGKRERDAADLTDNPPETEQEFLSLPWNWLASRCSQNTVHFLVSVDLDKPNTKMAGNVDVIVVKGLVSAEAAQVGAVRVDPVGPRLACRCQESFRRLLDFDSD